jgi:chromosome partitioning protein
VTTVAIANDGGSAGKTTTAVSLGALLAREGHSVRIIDMDPQHNASTWLGYDDVQGPTTGDVLLRRATIDQAAQPVGIPGLQVVPTNRDLAGDAVELGRNLGGEQRLRQALEVATPVDVTLIDCPGALSILTVAALVAADSVVTVANPTVKEISGIPSLVRTIEEVAASYNGKLKLRGIVPTQVPPPTAGALYSEAQDYLRATFEDLVTPPIRRTVRVAEAYANQMPLPEFTNDPVADDHRAVLAFLQDRGVL